MIDICDYPSACRASCSADHRHRARRAPDDGALAVLGVVGVISAFNFPVAVWSWTRPCPGLRRRRGLEAVGEDPLTALAVQALFERAAARFGDAPANLSQVLIAARRWRGPGGPPPRAAVSATGSTAWAGRWRRAWPAASPGRCWSSAATTPHRRPLGGPGPHRARHRLRGHGTAGQRCTTLRRLFVHATSMTPGGAAEGAYRSVKVGDPREAEPWSAR